MYTRYEQFGSTSLHVSHGLCILEKLSHPLAPSPPTLRLSPKFKSTPKQRNLISKPFEIEVNVALKGTWSIVITTARQNPTRSIDRPAAYDLLFYYTILVSEHIPPTYEPGDNNLGVRSVCEIV